MPKKFDAEIKARAVRMVRMVRDHLAEYGSVTATSAPCSEHAQTTALHAAVDVRGHQDRELVLK